MSANVRVAQVAELPGVGLEPPVAPDQAGVGTEPDCPRFAPGLVVNEGAVAHDAATIAAIQSGKDRNAIHVPRRGRLTVQG
jgi:hypothetical protein